MTQDVTYIRGISESFEVVLHEFIVVTFASLTAGVGATSTDDIRYFTPLTAR